MKALFTLVAFTLAAGYANAATYKCSRISKGDLVDEKTIEVTVTKSEISFPLNFFGKEKTVSGKYEKVAKNGSLIYDGSDLTDLVDQSSTGNIFVDPSLLNGTGGKIGLSVFQMGDDQGGNWVSDNFKCN